MRVESPGNSGCSFCGKPSAEVKSLVVAERANICDECVRIARWLTREKSSYGYLFRGMRRWAEVQQEKYRLIEVLVPSIILALSTASAVDPVLALIHAAMPFIVSLVLFTVIVLLYLTVLVLAYFALEERRVLARGLVALSWLASGFLIGRPFGWFGSGIAAIGALLFLALVWGLERREVAGTVGSP